MGLICDLNKYKFQNFANDYDVDMYIIAYSKLS